MWISVWITFNKNSNDYYYCFRTFQRLCFIPICIRIVSLTSASSLLIIQLVNITCKNVQNTSYAQKYTIILYYYGMFQCGGVFTFSETAVFAPRWGCVQLPRQLQNCIKFSHNSQDHTKFTSIVTSIKY